MNHLDPKAIVRRLVEEGQAKGDLHIVEELLALDFIDHSPLPGLPPTREGVKALFAALKAGFPDLEVVIHDQIEEDGKVVTRKTLRGTHEAAFIGIPGSGRRLSMEIIDILYVRDGKVTDHWTVVDRLAMMQQLGAMVGP
jgi:steroid delta-isomerase-like uncharacterized protein